jgi:hypothetical protein
MNAALLAAVLALAVAAPARAGTLLSLDFADAPLGPLAPGFPETACNAKWADGLTEGRGVIVGPPEARRTKSLRVTYLAHKIGPEAAVQFPCRFEPRDRAYVEYWVRFGEGFDPVRGGKLPGLCGGHCNSGGHKPKEGEGFSARIMWKKEGNLILYLYHMDQPGVYGEVFDLKTAFPPGEWHKISERVALNKPGQRDGVVEVWLDDRQVLKKDGLRLRAKDDVKIDKMYFSTFYGGAEQDWAPPKDETIAFDSFLVSDEPPAK